MGAHGVFAMTSERYPGKRITEEEELKHEIDAGRNIISAAKECCIKHLVFSSLPDTVKASDGQFKRIHHMNNKHTIEQLARKELDSFTSLIPGEYSVGGISTTSKTFVWLLTCLSCIGFFLYQLSLVTVCRLRGLCPSLILPVSNDISTPELMNLFLRGWCSTILYAPTWESNSPIDGSYT